MSASARHSFDDINAFKADFDEIYRRPDPRAYYQVLGGLDYVIPEVARPIFTQLAERLVAARGRPITILDIGCSYGVNAALLRYGLSLRQLQNRYLSHPLRALDAEQVAKYDARYFSGWPPRSDMKIMGLDTSAEAIAYARKAGILADGEARNLETEPLNERLRELIAGVDMVISTGCVGYITDITFQKIMQAAPTREPPWIASFVLRMFEYQKIAQTLARHGLVTEKLAGATFVQRRFQSRAEMQETLKALDALDIDPTGKEAEGLLHAELFVSRPEASTATADLTEIVSLTNGATFEIGNQRRLAPSIAA